MLCGLALFAFAAASLAMATFRVAVRGRVLVLPFAGNDARRVELTDLLVRRMTRMENDWTRLAERITAARDDVNERSRPAATHMRGNPIVDGETITVPGSVQPSLHIAAPRTSGDEMIKEIYQLAGVGSLENADLGVISLAGVSFSPKDILALLRAAPGVFARRVLRGGILTVADAAHLSVDYIERGVFRRNRVSESVEIRDDDWLPAIERLAFALQKRRVYLARSRNRHSWKRGRRNQSATAMEGVIEATTWKSCALFLTGYAFHLNHYRDGRATDREQALAQYDAALTTQPGYPRAAYNRATLLYNRYLPAANERAIEDFGLACASEDEELRALAFAGVAMARCQAVQRFGRDLDDHLNPASVAAEKAEALRPKLAEAVFAKGWVHQIGGAWTEAIGRYQDVVALPGSNPPERRIQSFALNNAAWITLNHLEDTTDGRRAAERLLWQAQALYPNKVAYTNLAEIARRAGRLTDAIDLYDAALALDPDYANALNERAIVRLALAARLASEGRDVDARRELAAARDDAADALRLAAPDDRFAATLETAFDAKEREALATIGVPGVAPEESSPTGEPPNRLGGPGAPPDEADVS